MNTEYIAHISKENKIQSVANHSQQTAKLAESFSVDVLKDINYFCGLMHDIGKYSDEFQKYIKGANLKVEHSICGAVEAGKLLDKNQPLTLLVQLCIAGHHSGIPDCGTINDTADMPTLYGRLKRQAVDYCAYSGELENKKMESDEFDGMLRRDCKTADDIIEKFSFFVRYCFSCLTDADSLDTRDFCEGEPAESMRCSFEKCAEALEKKLSGFSAVTELQKARQRLQGQAFHNIDTNANIYLMNMPTGSGKTLASMYCALRRINNSGGRLKRIIYVIPYNSIIDQTAEIFETMFSDHTDVLRHQSSFLFEEQENLTEDYRIAARAACDNWDAGIIITTAVQFFESLYGNKRGKLRKVHNMADSVIVFDEAHLMPREYLEPCLRGITYITKYLGSEALFLTATMPDFRGLLEQCSEGNLHITDLIEDKTEFVKFQKCSFSDLGRVTDEELVKKAGEYASSPVMYQEITITRQARTTEDRRSTGDTEIGKKSVIPYALYRSEGYISAALAQKVTGFDEDDLALLWQAIINMFENDHSAARGKMSMRKLYVFKHNSVLGNAPSGVLFDKISVVQKNADVPPRAFSDYEVSVDTDIPADVALIEML